MVSFSCPFPERIFIQGKAFQEKGPWVVAGQGGVLVPSSALNALNALKTVSLPAVQIVQAHAVPFPAYACAAALHAVHAFEDHSNIAETLSLEWVLWLARDTQLERALKNIGVDEKLENQYVVLLGVGSKALVEKELSRLGAQLELKPLPVRKAFGEWNDATLEELSLCRVWG